MDLDHFKKEINQLDSEFLQSILDGAALTMHQDESLRLGKSHEAFVIFWVEGEEISSLQELQDYLADQADELLRNYYEFNPISKEYFEKRLASLMKEYGETAFVAQPDLMPENTLIASNGDLKVLTEEDYIFKYGLYLNLEDKLNLTVSATKAKNWLQSGSAYQDYIAVNVFRFSAID